MALCNTSSMPFVTYSIASLKEVFYSASACDKEDELAEEMCNPEWIKEANKVIFLFFGVLLLIIAVMMCEITLFSVMGEKLVSVLRRQMLQ